MYSTFLGIDFGTSGVRIVLINQEKKILHSDSRNYPNGIKYAEDWERCCKILIQNIPKELKRKLSAICVDGTSGTLVACNNSGDILGNAIPYYLHCEEQEDTLKQVNLERENCFSTSNSVAKALRLVGYYGSNIILRHQADWITGLLIGNWEWGEEGNNLRLGWDLRKGCWHKNLKRVISPKVLPKIVKSGEILSNISFEISKELELPKGVKVISGTTDSNASVLAADPGPEDGVTILGSTTVIKKFVLSPKIGAGISNHRIGNRWLCGGASNAGAAILKRFFTDQELTELSRQINPSLASGLSLRPMIAKGERFPIDDALLEPILEPRPISDSLYLHALLEGLAKIEEQSWEAFSKLAIPKPKKIITLGGGAKNPQWRKIRERILDIPISTCCNPPALGVALIALKSTN